MPKVALTETFSDWESLLQAAAKYRDQKKLHVHLDKLQAAFDRLHELESLRASLRAQQQEATQEMGKVKDAGKDAAMEVRQILKAIVGPRNEALVQFNMRPLRKRGPRRKASAKTSPSS
jgi:CHASE3 domain sensor protein